MSLVVCVLLFIFSIVLFISMIVTDNEFSYSCFKGCFVIAFAGSVLLSIIAVSTAFHNGHEMDNAIKNVQEISKQEVVYISDLNECYDFLKIDKYIDTDKPVKIIFVKDIDRVKFSYRFDGNKEPYIAKVENIREVERGK